MEKSKLPNFPMEEGLRTEIRKEGFQLRKNGPKGQFGVCHISYVEKVINCAFAIYGITREELDSVPQNTVHREQREHLRVSAGTGNKGRTNFARVLNIARSIERESYGRNGHRGESDQLFILLAPFIKRVYDYIDPAVQPAKLFLDNALSVVTIMPDGNRSALLKILKKSEQFIGLRLDVLKEDVKNLMEFCKIHQITDSQLELITDALFLRNGHKELQRWDEMVLLPLINLITEKKWDAAEEFRNFLFANFQDWFPNWRRENEKGKNSPDCNDFIAVVKRVLGSRETKLSPKIRRILARACKIPEKAVLALA